MARPERTRQIALWTLHGALGVVAVAVVVASSAPGNAAIQMFGVVVLFWAGLIWAAVTLSALAQRRRGVPVVHPWRWTVLPLVVGAVALALVTQAPHRLRWEASRSAFDEVVTAQTQADLDRFSVRELGRNRSLGLMEADRVYQQGEAVVFEMGSGFIFTTVGYAYLPDGPFPELQINQLGVPEFERFDGDWYRWSASN